MNIRLTTTGNAPYHGPDHRFELTPISGVAKVELSRNLNSQENVAGYKNKKTVVYLQLITAK